MSTHYAADGPDDWFRHAPVSPERGLFDDLLPSAGLFDDLPPSAGLFDDLPYGKTAMGNISFDDLIPQDRASKAAPAQNIDFSDLISGAIASAVSVPTRKGGLRIDGAAREVRANTRKTRTW